MKTPDQIRETYSQLNDREKEDVSSLVDNIVQSQKIVETKMDLGDDESISPEEDKAARYPLIKLVSDRILSSKKMSTFSIAAPWGGGKTVFMHWLHDDLKKRPSCICVWFDAWKYEAVGNIVYPLVYELKTNNELTLGKDFDNKLNGVLSKLAVLGGVVTIAAVVGPQSLALWPALVEFYKTIKRKESIVEEQTRTACELREEFRGLVDYVLDSQASKPSKLVFLIDNLDRCSPDKVVAMLESVKNFLEADKTAFVFGVDKRVVAQGIKAKYGSSSEIDGDEYLEKIIHFTYELPFNPDVAVLNLLRSYERASAEGGLGSVDR